MADMNAGLILAQQPFNAIASLGQGAQAAQLTNQVQQQNALQNIYQQQGPGILKGDPGALNALAQVDPMAAFKVQSTRQGMALDSERLGVMKQQAGIQAQEWAMKQPLMALQLEQQRLTMQLNGLAGFYASGDKAGYDNAVKTMGLDPQTFSFDSFPAHAAMATGVLDTIKKVQEVKAGPKPQSELGKLNYDKKIGLVAGDGTSTQFRPATAEEAAK